MNLVGVKGVINEITVAKPVTDPGLLGISGLTNDMRELLAEIGRIRGSPVASCNRDLLLPATEIYRGVSGGDEPRERHHFHRRNSRELGNYSVGDLPGLGVARCRTK